MVATRRQAREWAIQMLTAADLNPPAEVESFINDYWQQLPTIAAEDGGSDGARPRGKLKRMAEERARGVLSSLGEIDEILSSLLENWDVFRLGTVERAVLRMGVWEMKNTDIPKPVIINEAIDLVNWFSTPKSRELINGVLDHYAKSF